DVDTLIRQAGEAGVRVAFSHPCFELWLLIHFRSYGAPSGGACAGLFDHVCTHIPAYRNRGKRIALADVAGRHREAHERALGLDRQHDRDGTMVPTQRDPSTGVWEFLESLGISY